MTWTPLDAAEMKWTVELIITVEVMESIKYLNILQVMMELQVKSFSAL